MLHNGFSPPKSATTMPLKPSLPVNPVRLPSVTIRCEMLPKTNTAPAIPQQAPESTMALMIVRLTGMPEYAAASRDKPTARIRKPNPVRHRSRYPPMATATAMTTPRFNCVPLTMVGSHECSDNSLVWGIEPVMANDCDLLIIGPDSR